MKRLKLAVGILIVLPIIIALSHIYLNSTTDKMADVISAAEKSARSGDISSSARQLDEFSTEWDHNKRIFATFIRHAELDFANQSAAKLKSYLDNDDKSNFYGECETLKMQIHHIAETERFSIDNIF